MQPVSVKIVTDSTNDLTPELLSKYDISVIPLYTVLDEASYRDGVDIDCEQLLAWCNSHKTTPKTAAVSVVDFTQFFSPFIQLSSISVFHRKSRPLCRTRAWRRRSLRQDRWRSLTR